MLGFLHHLFIPHRKNNHRAKILHNSSLFLILSIFVLTSIFAYLIKNTNPAVLGISYSISENELLNLTNKERTDNGLSPLTLNSELDAAASKKAADMFAKNYWAHFAPDGSTTPWGFIKDAGYTYIYAGENLAKGFTDSSSTVNAWMNSPTHRDNILSDKYKDIGFAIVPGTLQGEDTVLVVEMFGYPQTPNPAQIAGLPGAATQGAESSIPAANAPAQQSENTTQVPGSQAVVLSRKIDAGVTTRALSTILLSFIVFAFIMDLMIVERNKIPRVVGHNLDHVMLILLFLLFVVLKSSGVII